MIHKIEDVKSIKKLEFDDHIESKTMIAQYTHWNEGKPMFLMGYKFPNNRYVFNNFYIIGLANLKTFMKKSDSINKYNFICKDK